MPGGRPTWTPCRWALAPQIGLCSTLIKLPCQVGGAGRRLTCTFGSHFTRKHFLIHCRPKQTVWWRTCKSSSERWRPGSGRPPHETRPPLSGAAPQQLLRSSCSCLALLRFIGVAQSCLSLQVNSASHDLVHERWPTPSLHGISCLARLMQGPGAGGSGGAAARAAGRCGESGGGCSGRAPAHTGPG